LTLWTCKR